MDKRRDALAGAAKLALEIRPILGRRFGRIELWFNPVVERGLRGRDTNAALEDLKAGKVLGRIVLDMENT